VSEYELLDSGHQAKLERFGEIVLHRPSPQALWSPRLDTAIWDTADARYERGPGGGGNWIAGANAPESWGCRVGPLQLELRRTSFGHVGVFTEQIRFWAWLRSAVQFCAKALGRAPRVLNLFAYTGGSSLAAAMGGAIVTHCDASHGVVRWASENADLNDLGPGRIRWIVDDALKFLQREARRDNTYDGIILDPPSFGRGPRGEVWKLEEGATELLEAVVAVLDPDPGFILLSAHTPGIGPIALENLLAAALADRASDGALQFSHGEMTVESAASVFDLPAGTWASAHRPELQP
jgi:23S rRNA (cytosine1962-C5)-methyltransferase